MSKQSEKRITLTKGAAKEFASRIFQDDGSRVSYTKLCDGDLKEGKFHCAVGEAYFTFVNPSLKKVLKTSSDRISEYDGHSEGPTGAAIDALVEVADLKKSVSKERLASALRACVNANDGSDDGADRAESVARIWTKEVVPLLK